MVSQAGAMALAGLVPVCHSFACFLTPRANEQIFNNASEGTKVIYHGSLVGIVPGGPGHSHQMVRDIALMGSVPGMAAIEPYCEAEVGLALDWAVREAEGPVYVRLVSPPWQLPFEPRTDFAPGRGTVLREGGDGAFVCTGPVLVSQAWLACERLAEDGIDFGLVALPWLRGIDGAWLAEAVPRGDDRDRRQPRPRRRPGRGGAGGARRGGPEAAARVRQIGVEGIPECGTNDEVLRVARARRGGPRGRGPVIVATHDLGALAGRVTMVDGGFDPIHAGHVAYFRAAAELGDPVLCNVSGDDWVGRKHPPLLRQGERVQVLDAIRFLDYVHASRVATAEVLERLRPRAYAKGADWRDRLPEAELEACERHGIRIVFLETMLGSSTEILRRYRAGDGRRLPPPGD